MRNRASLAVFLATAVTALGQARQQPLLGDAQMEQFLQSARVVDTRGAGKGITDSVRATLSDGTLTHDAHIQTIEEFKQEFKGGKNPEINFRDQWQFNVAAYKIDRLLGLHLVPATVERSWNGRRGSFTWWIDDVLMDEGDRIKKKVVPPESICWSEQLWLLRVFDALIDNIDRNLGNIVISKSWRLWAIDHTRAFRFSKEPRVPATLIRIDRGLLQQLKGLDFSTLKREVGKYLNDADIRLVLTRRDGIVAHFEKMGEAGLFTRRDPVAGCKATLQ